MGYEIVSIRIISDQAFKVCKSVLAPPIPDVSLQVKERLQFTIYILRVRTGLQAYYTEH